MQPGRVATETLEKVISDCSMNLYITSASCKGHDDVAIEEKERLAFQHIV